MRLVLDPIACEAHGLCSELLPETITLDDWGYPVIAAEELPEALERLARRAVRVCPTLALRLRANAERRHT
jgi:ferredoxin